jgi:catechol 2,3-dioxygenase-like lactoylglutathione lyase family enzyme
VVDGALVAFVASGDLDGAVAFYRDRLGLTLVEVTPFAAVFDVDGTTLRLTLVEDHVPAGHTVLGWTVADVAAAVAELAARGLPAVRFAGLEQDEAGVWRSPGGARVAWFRDGDGNVLSLTQL